MYSIAGTTGQSHKLGLWSFELRLTIVSEFQYMRSVCNYIYTARWQKTQISIKHERMITAINRVRLLEVRMHPRLS